MDPTTLPLPDLPTWLQTALAYAAILLAALTALAQGLRWAVPRLRAVADRTETLADDAIVAWLGRALGVLTTALDWVRYLAPQVRLGTPTPTLPPPSRPSTPTRPTYIPPLSLLALWAILVTLAGCGTWASRARTTIEVSAVAVDVADRAVASALTRTCASVADLPAGSPERAAALDACLTSHHYDDAITAIRVADRALRAAQAAVDAGERAGDPSPWRGVAACLAVAVQEVLGAVQAAGVTVPPALTAGASMLAGVVGACEAPESADEATS